MRRLIGLFQFIHIITLVVFLSSCGKSLNYIGQTAAAPQRIAINKASQDLTYWDAGEVSIRYKIIDNKESLSVSGSVQIDDSILYTFPSVKFFYLYLYLLDVNGLATSRHDISPLYSSHATFPDQLQFSRRLPKDEGTVSIAFSYWGVFEERSSILRRRSDDWEIHHNPFMEKL